jgi:PAS domain-containing protein
MSLGRIYRDWISPQRWLERMGVGPSMQIVFGLVMLTTCVLMFARALQLTPSEDDATVRARSLLFEMATFRVGEDLSGAHPDRAKEFLQDLLARQPDVLSAAVRRIDGKILLATPNHQENWRGVPAGANTPTHMQVLLYDNQTPWARLEMAFSPLPSTEWSAWWSARSAKLTIFILGSCFVLYWLFFSRMLRMLDPSEAVPQRMQLIMDTLVEGVAIVDNDDRIVLVNQSFCQIAFSTVDRLMGQALSSLPWLWQDQMQEAGTAVYPWQMVKSSNLPERGAAMRLQIGTRHARSLNVNASPILDPGGTRRGVLVTFDDQTVMEADNVQLAKLIAKFAESRPQIHQFREQLPGPEQKDLLAELERLAAAASEIADVGRSAVESMSGSVGDTAPANGANPVGPESPITAAQIQEQPQNSAQLDSEAER